jgi:putative membrane protein
MIWVNVGPTAADASVSETKGKVTKRQRALSQLRERKILTLRLAISFAYAVKHHLRNEPGTEHDDYKGVLPASFARFDEIGYDTTASSSSSSIGNPPSADPDVRQMRNDHGLTFHASGVGVSQAGPNTPLLGDTHRTIEFHPYSAKIAMPLPLV